MLSSKKLRVREIVSFDEMESLYPLLKQLTPTLTKKRYQTLLKQMLNNNYRMAAVYQEKNCIALSGFWINTKLYSGKYVEIDNLIVDKNYRSAGAGKLLCDWIVNLAKKEGCETAMLDAYVENAAAHKFYFREGYMIRGFHFIKKIEK